MTRRSTSTRFGTLEEYSLTDTLLVGGGLVVAVLLGLVALSYGWAAVAVAGGLVAGRLAGVEAGLVRRAAGALADRLRDGARRGAAVAASTGAAR